MIRSERGIRDDLAVYSSEGELVVLDRSTRREQWFLPPVQFVLNYTEDRDQR